MPYIRTVACLFLGALVGGCGSSGSEADGQRSTEQSWLFVQSGENASLEPHGDGALLVLSGLSPVTVAFTDRPDRESRSLDSAWFLTRWNALFEGDPPNVALVLADEDERTIVVTVVEARHGAQARDGYYVVTDFDGGRAGLPMGEDLGPASLFIDNVSSPDDLVEGSDSTEVAVDVTSTTADRVTVAYMGMHSNEPETFGNSIVVWEGDLVGWFEPPLATAAIQGNAPVGELEISNLSPGATSYTFGYAVGTSSTAIASTVTIHPGGPSEMQTTSVSIETIAPDAVVVGYSLPTGAIPNQFGHWVGVWEGASVDISGPPPAFRSDVMNTNSQGSVPIEGIQLLRGTVYTVGYFVGADPSALAATVSFAP